jgi:hypothetical protein
MPYFVAMVLRNRGVFVLLLLIACGGRAADDPGATSFDRAESAAQRNDFRKAAQHYEAAIREEKEAERRELAEVRLANLKWRILGKSAVAQARLLKLSAVAERPSAVLLELARAEAAGRNYEAARATASKAISAATRKAERFRAQAAHATYLVDADGTARPSTADAAKAVGALRGLIAEQGPTLNTSRLLVRAGLLGGDFAAVLDGVNAYYHVSPQSPAPQQIAVGHRLLTDGGERDAVAALAGVRFFREAALLARMRNDTTPLAREVIAYSDALDGMKRSTEAYYLQLANGSGDDDDLRDGITRELRALWPSLRWPGAAPRFSFNAATKEIAARFGTLVNIGKTGSFIDAHIAHRVADRALKVDQYGQSATVRFIELDAVVSNGYSEWKNDGRSGDGGWGTATEIYQVRPRYADSALRQWQSVADSEIRTERDKRIADETQRDLNRGKLGPFIGTSLRLERQYLDAILAQEKTRDAFLARVERDVFNHSILLHEGRHAIDAKSGDRFSTADLEYRAKLSAIALADAPLLALGDVLGDSVGDGSPHGIANERLANGLTSWMSQNRAAIAGLDPARPLLAQADKLTPEQIRAAAGSLDPLAKPR